MPVLLLVSDIEVIEEVLGILAHHKDIGRIQVKMHNIFGVIILNGFKQVLDNIRYLLDREALAVVNEDALQSFWNNLFKVLDAQLHLLIILFLKN